MPRRTPSSLSGGRSQSLFLGIVKRAGSGVHSRTADPFAEVAGSLRTLISRLSRRARISVACETLPTATGPESDSARGVMNGHRAGGGTPSIRDAPRTRALTSQDL